MENIQIFNSSEFGEIRAVNIDGGVWFVGKDVTEILGYQNASKALIDHVDDEDKLNNDSLLSLGQRGGWLINESGLYSLILSSKLESAKRFKRWVTSEVLPAIRNNGGYITGQEQMSDAELMARALTVAQKTIERREFVIRQLEADTERMHPKEIFADAVSSSNSSILIGELAKILKGNGFDIGQNRLFRWLREHGYLIRRNGADFNMPTQKAMDKGLFKIKETAITKSDGTSIITKTVKVTGAGQVYFTNLFLGRV